MYNKPTGSESDRNVTCVMNLFFYLYRDQKQVRLTEEMLLVNT